MQALNLRQALVQGLYTTPSDYKVYMFDGQVPSDLDNLPFDLTNKNLIDNCVSYFYVPQTQVKNNTLDIQRNTTELYTGFLNSPYINFDDTYNRVTSRNIYYGYEEYSPEEYQAYKDSLAYSTWYDRTIFTQDAHYFKEIGREYTNIIQYFDSPRKVSAFGFRQTPRNYTYGGGRTPASSWARTVEFRYWDDTLNEGQGDWVQPQDAFSCSSSTNQFDLDQAVTTRAIRITARSGQWGYHPGNTVYGNPQWRVYYIRALVDKSIQAESASSVPVSWALVCPEDSSASSVSLLSYNTLTNPITQAESRYPCMLIDCGSPGSGATLELINNPVPTTQKPQVYKLNLKIDD